MNFKKQLYQYFILITLILTSTYCKAQDWYPDSATWQFNKQEQLSFPAHGYVNYKVADDTILNGVSAKLIHVDTLYYDGNTSMQDSIFVYESNSNVYYWDGTQFVLMYDFNLGIGDTLAVEIEQLKCDSVSSIIVDSISYLNVNNDSLKVQHISYTLYATTELGYNHKVEEELIEKVGSESEFIFAPSCIIKDEFVYTGLRCYNDDSINYRNAWWENQFSGVKCDSLINDTTTNLREIKQGNISIYPNPTNDYVTISSQGNNLFGVFYIEIFNSSGKKIKKVRLKEKTTIRMKGFENGVYFFRIYQDTKQIDVIKIIKY